MGKATTTGASRTETGTFKYFISYVDSETMTFGNMVLELPYDRFFDIDKIAETEAQLEQSIGGSAKVTILSFQRLNA